MGSNIFAASERCDKDIEPLLDDISFPLTKAEIIHKAEVQGVPPSTLALLRRLPSRFYQSKGEFIGYCLVSSMLCQRQDSKRWSCFYSGKVNTVY
jgi:hypothetical protein